MEKTEHFRKLERMYLSAPINNFYKPTILVGDGTSQITSDVRKDFFHAANAVHGSVYFKMLDDSAFFAVNSIVQDVFVLTVSFNVYLTSPISEGNMTASGRIIHRSKRLFIAESRIVDSTGKEIAYGNGTFMSSKIPLSPEIGYK